MIIFIHLSLWIGLHLSNPAVWSIWDQ